ncbi:MAG: helix-turn-helix domain-containing protein [Halodesulfurarchaeum sp.]
MTEICKTNEQLGRADRSSTKRPLCAFLEIGMEPGCPLAEIDEGAKDIFVRQIDGRCQADVVVENEELEVVHFEKSIESECVGSIFARYDCVPHIARAEGGHITIMTFPPERDMLADLVSDLRERDFEVSVKRLISLENYEETGRHPPLLCDVSILTKKEREAVDLAVERGYYDEHNGTRLQDLADELGISKSALSSRLSSAESKLMEDLFSRRGNGAGG